MNPICKMTRFKDPSRTSAPYLNTFPQYPLEALAFQALPITLIFNVLTS